MISVLFVCLGNICRSPMAEGVFRSQVARAGLDAQIITDSAGTGDWHIGKEPHEGTRRMLDLNEISYEGIRARQVTSGDFEDFDYMICMDDSNLSNLRNIPGGEEAVIIKFMDLIPGHDLQEVPDPYFTGNFEQVFELMNTGCQALLERIRTEKNI